MGDQKGSKSRASFSLSSVCCLAGWMSMDILWVVSLHIVTLKTEELCVRVHRYRLLLAKVVLMHFSNIHANNNNLLRDPANI